MSELSQDKIAHPDKLLPPDDLDHDRWFGSLERQSVVGGKGMIFDG